MSEVQTRVMLAEGQHAHVVTGDVQEIVVERFRGQAIGDRPVVFRTGEQGAEVIHDVPVRHDIGGAPRTPHASIEVAPNTVGVSGIQREFEPLTQRFNLQYD